MFANFFFWKPGSDLQKSLVGLFRSLLHDILEVCPEIVPLVLPDHWRTLKSTPWQVMRDIPISNREIRDAFTRAVSNTSLYRNHCFCFFIDGLDEYEGSHQDDARTLVDLLISWTTAAPDGIKLCVSSREHNLYMNAFSSDKRIRLHDLTRADMHHYVSDKLGHMELTERRDLISMVVDNSGGIFLWVVLEIKKLRELVENGSTISELEREINGLPREMDGLFNFLTDSITQSDQKRAYCTFSILLSLARPDTPGSISLGLYQHSFLDDYIQDSSFAARLDMQKDRLPADEIRRRKAVSQKRVVGSCKGLVDINSDKTLGFTHRSVPEFLEAKVQLVEQQRILEGFQPVEALCHLTLAAITTNPRLIRSLSSSSWVKWRAISRVDEPPYVFLESLSTVMSQAKQLMGGRLGWPEEQVLIQGAVIGSSLLKERIVAARADIPIDPIYPAAFVGNYGYVRWRSSQQDHASWSFSREMVLISLIRANLRVLHDSRGELLDTVDVLMSGRWTDETVTDISYYPMYEFSNTPDAKAEETKDTRKSVPLTLWHHLLVMLYIFGSYIENPLIESSDDHYQLRNISCVLQRFLENGADPRHFRFSAQRLDHDETDPDTLKTRDEQDWRFKLVLGRDEREVSFKLLRQDFEMRPMEVASTVELVEKFNLENKESLLQLIDMRCRELDSDETKGHSTCDDGPSINDAGKEPAAAQEHIGLDGTGLAFEGIADQEEHITVKVDIARGNEDGSLTSLALGTRISILAFLAG